MNWKLIIATGLIAGLATAGYFIARYLKKQAKLVKEYSVTLLGIKFTTISEDLLEGVVTVRIGNKSAIEATVNTLYADLYLDGQWMGNISPEKPFVIPAAQKNGMPGFNDVPVKFAFVNKQILKNIVSTLLKVITIKDVPYQVKGFVKISSGGIGTSVEFDYEGFLKKDMFF